MTDTDRAALEAALDDNPADHAARWNLADLLEEWGDRDCEPLRWLATRQRFPRPPLGEAAAAWGYDVYWNWFQVSDRGSGLPEPLFSRLTQFSVPDEGGGFDCRGVYPTRAEAERDFCAAWHLAVEDGWKPK